MSIAESFGQSAFAQFVTSPAGRLTRLVAGLGLVALGYAQGGSGSGLVLMVIGLIPLTTGIFDWCLMSALLGGPISGARIRRTSKS